MCSVVCYKNNNFIKLPGETDSFIGVLPEHTQKIKQIFWTASYFDEKIFRLRNHSISPTIQNINYLGNYTLRIIVDCCFVFLILFYGLNHKLYLMRLSDFCLSNSITLSCRRCGYIIEMGDEVTLAGMMAARPTVHCQSCAVIWNMRGRLAHS
jgi:hypothetical protein